MKPKKKKPQHAERKRSFDETLACYRNSQDLGAGLGAVGISDSGKPAKNVVKPTLTDFRCDVEKVFTKILRDEQWQTFTEAYILYDSDDPIDMEMHAQRLLGDLRHGLEQGIGAEFIKRGIFPLNGKGGYFKSIRQPRGKI